MPHPAGRHFLQIPGPTNVPEQVLRAISAPTIDHRGPQFARLGLEVLAGLRRVLRTQGPVVVYPSSGTGAWEAALVNTLSPGDRVLAFETGHFATLWRAMAERLGLEVDWVEGDWRHGVDPDRVAAVLRSDPSIAAVMVVHNETSTGVTSRVAEVREAMDSADSGALLLVDTISSLGSIDYRHDEWGVDVTVGCSQKGLMLPPGLGFNALSEKALAASERARLPRSYWEWAPVLEVLCLDEREHSAALTAVMVENADEVRHVILERFDMSLGAGLGKVAGRVFRIGHLGDFNDLMLAGALCGVEMGLRLAGVPVAGSGVEAALAVLEREPVAV